MSGVQKKILKMAIKLITSCKRPLSTFTNLNIRVAQQKI